MSELLMSELPDYPITDHPCLYQWSLSMVFINGLYQWSLSMVFINGRGSHWETEQTTLSHLTAHLS